MQQKLNNIICNCIFIVCWKSNNKDERIIKSCKNFNLLLLIYMNKEIIKNILTIKFKLKTALVNSGQFLIKILENTLLK